VLVVALRDDLLVGRKLPVDHARDEQPRTDAEEHVVFTTFVFHVAIAVGEQAPELGQRLARQDGLDVVALAGPRRRGQRQAVSVGGDHRHAVGLDHEQGAVQVVAGVFTRDRKLRLGDELTQRRRRHGGGIGQVGRGRCRKVADRHRRHLRFESIRRHGHVIAVLRRTELHVAIGQRSHDLVQLLGRERDGARLFHGRFAAARERHLDVGREQANRIAIGFNQHVRQDGNRVLALDDLLEKLQFTHKIGLPRGEFHVSDDLDDGLRPRELSKGLER
jgi:hypothetical protein